MGKYPSIADQMRAANLEVHQEIRQDIIDYATAANAEIMNSSPAPTGVVVTVDGVVGAAIADADVGSVIDFKYQRGTDISAFALQTLWDLSPVGSGKDTHPGEYRDAHTLYLNGSPVADLSDWQSGDDAYILNAVPYARKIEMGTEHMTVPGSDHVYQQAEQIVNAKYGAVVQFTYLAAPSTAPITGGGNRVVRKPKASSGGAGNLCPALLILEG